MMTDIDRIREALQFIPVGGDYERWRVAAMIYSEVGEAGRDSWDEWRGDRGNDRPGEADSTWRSASKDGSLKIGTLFHEAKQNGWRDDGRYQKPTPEEIAERRRIAAERAAKEEAEIARERADTAMKAAAILKAKATTEAKADHPYLVRKKVSPTTTLREIDAGAAAAILGYAPETKSGKLTGRLLVVPVKQGDGISTLELIDGDKRKAALAGRGSKAGGYWATERLPDGDGAGPTLLIGEGVATVLSASAASGKPGIAALSSGNLPTVAKAMRERYPQAVIVILADLVKATGEPDPHAIEAARSAGGKLAIPDFGGDREPDMTDLNDMAVICGLEAVERTILNASEPARGEHQPGTDDVPAGESESEGEKVSQASALVAFVEAHAELFHDQNGEVFAEAKDTRETRRLDGRQFKDWLVSNFYGKTGKSPRDQSVREALSTLAGLGRFRGECRDVFIRVAMQQDSYYLDLAEPGLNRAVRISAGQWELVANPPVRFIRPETLRPLPEPKRGGKLDVLWKIANIPMDARLLVLAWLGECLRPDTPFPVLELMGEQGSAKSTTQTALRRLIDPNACDLRSAPKAVEDMFVGAGASWLVSYENISHLSAPMQDALCVLATGGGFAKRKLYSDADESVITVKRPVVLNGISVAVTAQDLVDRTLSIETPVIHDRVETTDLWKRYDAAHGELLGALLDVMATALDLLPGIHIPAAERPRLAEFARFGMAVAKATGHRASDFTRQFTACRQEAIARTLDASPVATAVLAWCEQNPMGAQDTAGNFMTRMEPFKPQRAESWPWSAKGFADALRRAAPALRQHGVECRSLPKTGGVIRWEIRPRGKFANPRPECPECPAEDGKQDMQDLQDMVQEFFPALVEVEI